MALRVWCFAAAEALTYPAFSSDGSYADYRLYPIGFLAANLCLHAHNTHPSCMKTAINTSRNARNPIDQVSSDKGISIASEKNQS